MSTFNYHTVYDQVFDALSKLITDPDTFSSDLFEDADWTARFKSLPESLAEVGLATNKTRKIAFLNNLFAARGASKWFQVDLFDDYVSLWNKSLGDGFIPDCVCRSGPSPSEVWQVSVASPNKPVSRTLSLAWSLPSYLPLALPWSLLESLPLAFRILWLLAVILSQVPRLLWLLVYSCNPLPLSRPSSWVVAPLTRYLLLPTQVLLLPLSRLPKFCHLWHFLPRLWLPLRVNLFMTSKSLSLGTLPLQLLWSSRPTVRSLRRKVPVLSTR